MRMCRMVSTPWTFLSFLLLAAVRKSAVLATRHEGWQTPTQSSCIIDCALSKSYTSRVEILVNAFHHISKIHSWLSCRILRYTMLFLLLYIFSSATIMPHNLRKKRKSNPHEPLQLFGPEHSLLPNHDVEHAMHNEHHTNTQVPFYDGSTHVAYGWQQMCALPDFPGLQTLVHGVQNNLPRNPGGRPQTWPINEYQQVAKSAESSRFKPSPRHGQELRCPPSLAEPEDRSVQCRTNKPDSKSFASSLSAKPEDEGVEDADSRHCLALLTKEVDKKMGMDQTQKSLPSSLKPTEDLRKTKPATGLERLVSYKCEHPQHVVSEAGHMQPLLEESTPLTIRGKCFDISSTDGHPQVTALEQARKLRFKQNKENTGQLTSWPQPSELRFPKHEGNYIVSSDPDHGRDGVEVTLREASEVTEIKDEEINGLTMAIAQLQLSASVQSSPHECKYPSIVPDPLGLAATKTKREEKVDLTELRIESDTIREEDGRGSLRKVKNGSVESFATDISSEFENLSIPDGSKAEHNGSRRKWYRGFYRSE